MADKIVNIGTPNPKQVEFFKARERYIAYGGARGGGKSWAIQRKAVLMALKFKGINILILRRTHEELRQNHIVPICKLCNGIARYNDQRKEMSFPNGSVILFGYCGSSSDLLRYQGQQYDVIFIDEATQFDFEVFDVLKACVRGVNDFPKRIYLTMNPGGIGHTWAKRLFIDRDFTDKERPEDYKPLIKATVDDNTALQENDPEYIKQLESYTGDRLKAWRYGEWDVYDGLFFKEFKQNMHVCVPFDVPTSWRRYRVFDYGMDMLACLWIAVDYDGSAWVYDELYLPNQIISEAAERIMLHNDRDIFCTYAPSDLWGRSQESGRSRAELFAVEGLPLIEVNSKRIAGWYAVREYLKPIKGADGDTTARIKIFDTCRNLIRCLSQIQYSEKDMEDAATEPHELTHIVDALRYFCVSRTLKPREPEIPRWQKEREDYTAQDELDEFLSFGG